MCHGTTPWTQCSIYKDNSFIKIFQAGKFKLVSNSRINCKSSYKTRSKYVFRKKKLRSAIEIAEKLTCVFFLDPFDSVKKAT